MTFRDREATRRRLLEVGHEEIYLHGFTGASVELIVASAGVTKGAFFHHFASKTDFGYAVVVEVIAPIILAQWVDPLQQSDDPLATIATAFERGAAVLRAQRPILGCPLGNLAQEMGPLDEGFRRDTSLVFELWRASYRDALERAQSARIVTRDVDPGDAAHGLVAQIEGTLALARSSQDPATLDAGARTLRRYVDSLRG